MLNKFYSKPVYTSAIFIAISILCIFIIRDFCFGESRNYKYLIFSIRFEYYGMDAKEIEKIITIPLEEKLVQLNNLFEIRSCSEYEKSIITLYFTAQTDYKNTFLALRDIVDGFYNSLPKAVQKPRIISTGANNRAAITIAVFINENSNYSRTQIEATLKKDFETIDGVAEVIVAGGGVEEIRLEYNHEKLTDKGLSPTTIASALHESNIFNSNAIINESVFNTNLRFNTKLFSIEQIKAITINCDALTIPFKDIANIGVFNRKSEEIVRVNAQECISIQIKAASNANILKLSKLCKNVLKNSFLAQDAYKVLNDSGESLFIIIKNVCVAFLNSFICIILIIPFFYESIRSCILLILFIVFNCIWTLAILKIMKIDIDQNIISGITISTGLIVDPALLVAGNAEIEHNINDYIHATKNLLSSIIASSFTTMMVLIPLFNFEQIVPGTKSVAAVVAIMLLCSLILSCIFLPCFLFNKKKKTVQYRIQKSIKNLSNRLAYKAAINAFKRPKLIIAVYAFLFVFTFILFFILGKNINLAAKENIIYATVEYESEKTKDSIDTELIHVLNGLKKEKGVSFIRSEARKGSIDFEIGFDDSLNSREILSSQILKYSKYIKNGNLYLPDAGSKKNTENHQIEISVLGDEHNKCKELASNAASAFNYLPDTIQTVLNFKKPEQVYYFFPDRDRLVNCGTNIEYLASMLRWAFYGPVVSKWMLNKNEIDIRVVGEGYKNGNTDKLFNIQLATPGGNLPLHTLGLLRLHEGSGKLYRMNGMPAAHITVHLNSKSSSMAIKTLKQAINSLPKQKGYALFLAKEYELLDKDYKKLFLAFIGSIIAILLVLTALTENLIKAIIISTIIPVSCFFPLAFKFLAQITLEMGDIVGLVVISGISVNNAIYIAESNKTEIKYKLREKIQSIIVTSLTSIAGAASLVFISKEGFSRSLSLSILLGTFGSMFAAIFLYPAIFNIFLTRKKQKLFSL